MTLDTALLPLVTTRLALVAGGAAGAGVGLTAERVAACEGA